MDTTAAPEIVLETRAVYKDFAVSSASLKALRIRVLSDVSLTLHRGKALAVVGESGSGKSTVARIIAKMHRPTSGKIFYRGRDIEVFAKGTALLDYRQCVQMVWQDPFGSLNPTHTIYHHIARPLLLHGKVSSGKDLPDAVYRLLETVGLTPAKETAAKYPHQLSGGQRQRINIARTLAVGAEVVLADEPTSMLDVSIRIGVLNLMERMKKELGVAMLYITHDIATARYVAEDLGVMYVGHLVEWGEVDEILHHPQHPYTRLLISAVPDPSKSIHAGLEGGRRGDIPLWTAASTGCPFAGRCTSARSQCRAALPPVTRLADNHFVRCFLYA